MNESECADIIDAVEWLDPKNLVSLAILAFINVLVIVGNCLVIAAVFCSHKLRSVTNFFIVSLAVADLLVGIAVLPFSATWEVFKVSLLLHNMKIIPALKQYSDRRWKILNVFKRWGCSALLKPHLNFT